MDFELEMGFFVSQPVPHGKRMAIEDARDHIFGFVLLNASNPIITTLIHTYTNSDGPL